MPSTTSARPRTRARVLALLPVLVAVLLALPAEGQGASRGVEHLRATRAVTAGASAKRGVTVRGVLPRRDRALRLGLTSHGKVVARRTFRLRRGGTVNV